MSPAAAAAIAAAFGQGPPRFDAHQLYVLFVVFAVPIAYFFVPPPAGVAPALLADTFRSAVLCALLVGKSLEDTLRFANAAAALKCRDLGRRGCPTRDEVDRFLG